ncbi:hypothetical protein PUNSTDRAFT_36719, partial [Punctularia strigosozonata HHB-11173 SS5]
RRGGDTGITMRWTPGHVGVEGNEYVDGKVKEAARGTSSAVRDLPILLRKTLPYSKTAATKTFKKTIAEKLNTHYRNSKHLTRLKRTDPKFKASRFYKLATSLPRQNLL